MPYFVRHQNPIYYQISVDDVLDGLVDVDRNYFVSNHTNTSTRYIRSFKPEFLEKFDFNRMIRLLMQFNQKYEYLRNAERSTLYSTFFIPKKSRGFRRIDAPNDELMGTLRELKTLLETEFFASYHTSAFAYVKGRSTVDAVKRHQQNASKWFLKLDFSNFFGSTTEEFAYTQISQIFPFSEICNFQNGRDELRKALNLCFLNGGLPQGTPISPTITNLMIIPIDFELCNVLRHKKEHFVYTRYADDLLISSKIDFCFRDVESLVNDILNKHNAPFQIKSEKTRYGSANGSNWNLGVMLNQNNEITVGWKNKKKLKMMCASFVCAYKANEPVDVDVANQILGLISYFRMVEKQNINKMIQEFNAKHNVNIEELLKTVASGGVI